MSKLPAKIAQAAVTGKYEPLKTTARTPPGLDGRSASLVCGAPHLTSKLVKF
jgi:hypothetical protein